MNHARCEWLESRRLLAAHVAGSSNVYDSIQAAVDAAPSGGTVTVDAGTYDQRVYIGKRLTVRGAKAGVDARSGSSRGSGESVLRGISSSSGRTYSFLIDADNVVLDGFTVQDQTTQSTNRGAAIVIGAGRSGTQILNNIVQNNVAGLFLANSSSTNAALIRHNVFRSNNNDGTNGGRAIYTDGGITGGTLRNVTIDANTFSNNRGGNYTTYLEAAIALQARSYDQLDIRITNNRFDSNGKALLAYNSDRLTITGNYITTCRDVDSGALRFEGDVHDVTITGNTLTGNPGRAIRLDEKAISGRNSGFVITGNNIYNNREGLRVDSGTYSGFLDARNNYWGSSSGPGGDGSGSGNPVYAQGNDVDFSPWATSFITTAPGAGGGGGAETALPAPWTQVDIGSVGITGSASVSNGTYTVRGAGADIWGSADSFHFVYQKLTGDGTIIARVVGLQNTNTFAKAGVMMRESLAANSKEASVVVSPGSGGVRYLRRLSTGGSTTTTTHSPLSAPYWVKLVRKGNTFTSYRSLDGVTWQFMGSDVISMASTIYVGLAVCSHNTSALNTATFDHVSVIAG
jgi:regulation of enolase protein 1 (concanavalin A-like superfamily)/nitrous oxidase accessory protein NosD